MISINYLLKEVDKMKSNVNDSSVVSIMVETGEDEAIMIGTNEAYLNLVKTLLTIIASEKLRSINMYQSADQICGIVQK